MSDHITAVPSVIAFAFGAHSVRVQEIDGTPWFCLADVCSILGYSNSRDALAKHCREAGVAKRDISSAGQKRSLTFVSEGNLYRLIIKSRKEEAQRFEVWVCDEVLPAIRRHGHYEDHGKMGTLIGQTIGTDGFHMLASIVKGKVSSLPAVLQRRASAKIWSQAHAAFGVRSAADIPVEQLDSARNFIAAYVVLEGEFMPRKPVEGDRLNIHFPIQALASRREGMFKDRGDGYAWLDVSLEDVGYQHGSLCEVILFELQRAGYVVDAARWELATYRNKLRGIDSFVRGLNKVIEEPQRYAIVPGDAA
jgi:prophage antirepressor-like protein